MTRPALLLLFLLAAGCGTSAPSSGTENKMEGGGVTGSAAPVPGASPTDLTGLYEGKSGETVNQLCMVAKGPDKARFGLVVWGSNLHSCSGAGSAVRSGERLTLTMAGDSSCAINATISNGIVTLPATLPTGCAYYCGARASMTGAAFTRTGGTAADAAKAKDLAGDPLC